MKPSASRPALLLALPWILLAAGCDREDRGAAAAPEVAETDTTNDQALDGLSSEQVEEQARPLTPEEAARLGMTVDTTIHMESLTSPEDSALMRGGQPAPPVPAPRDTARDGAPR